MARPAIKKGHMEDAAMELFATKGLARTTVRDIAQKAKVGEGALYRHWSGKNDMAWALYHREVRAFSELLRPWLQRPDGSLGDRLIGAVRFIYGFYQDHPVKFSFILLTQHGFPSERMVDEQFDPFNMVTEFVRGEMHRGHIPPDDPELLAALVMGAVLQPLIMHRYGRVNETPIALADRVALRLASLLGYHREERL